MCKSFNTFLIFITNYSFFFFLFYNIKLILVLNIESVENTSFSFFIRYKKY